MNARTIKGLHRCLAVAGLMMIGVGPANEAISADAKTADKSFQATVTDNEGKEHDIKNVIFYWEEKISETAFVPHELRHLPVKSGSATVNVKFDAIKQVDFKPGADKTLPVVSITLTSGKSKEFSLGIPGSIKGQDEFGEVELPAAGLKRMVIK